MVFRTLNVLLPTLHSCKYQLPERIAFIFGKLKIPKKT
jgi:hypothetical protein